MDFAKCKCNRRIYLQFADSSYNLLVTLTVADCTTAQFNYTHAYYLFVDSTNCSIFIKYDCGFRKFACFCSDLERYSFLGICLWNPKQRRRSKKSRNVADLILACCGIRLQCTEGTFWPCYVQFLAAQ